MNQKYTVIGYYSNTNERFASSISAISAEDAEVCVLNDVGDENLVIVGTVLGDVLMDTQVMVRTMSDANLQGTELVCRDGGKHTPNWQTLTHLSGTVDELNVFCLKCGRPGAIYVSAEADINW